MASTTSATPATANNASPSSPTANGARRGSDTQKFSGLMNQKRASVDGAAEARRKSFNEQKPAPGVIGSLWQKYTKG